MTASIRTLIPSLIALACRSVLLLACGMVAAGLAPAWPAGPGHRLGRASLCRLAAIPPPACPRFTRLRRVRLAGADAARRPAGRGRPDPRPLPGRCPVAQGGVHRPCSSLRPFELPAACSWRPSSAAGWITDRLIRVSNHVHLLTCSPAGGGKGVGVLIPNLLSYPGNCVVIDPKGELFRATAEHRSTSSATGSSASIRSGSADRASDTLNPFDFINHKADDFIDQCATWPIRSSSAQHDEKDPHWNESAIANVTAFAAFVCGAETRPRKSGTWARCGPSPPRGAGMTLAVKTMQDMGDACQGVIARLGGSLTWHEGEELASVHGHARPPHQFPRFAGGCPQRRQPRPLIRSSCGRRGRRCT